MNNYDTPNMTSSLDSKPVTKHKETKNYLKTKADSNQEPDVPQSDRSCVLSY